jgi:putative sigma-54 modulation protein
MIINITNRHDKVSPAVRERIEAWLEHSQERFDIISSAQVTIDKNAHLEEVEATLHAGGREINAKASAENLYAALDALADKIDRQLEKVRDKQIHKKGTPKHTTLIGDEAVNDDDFEEEVYQA